MLLQQQNSCGIILLPLELIQANASENAGPLEVVLSRIPGRGDDHAGVATPECPLTDTADYLNSNKFFISTSIQNKSQPKLEFLVLLGDRRVYVSLSWTGCQRQSNINKW
jgi:hypothetical protein